MREAELHNEFFTSVLTGRFFHICQVGVYGVSEVLPTENRPQLQDQLIKLDSHKSMGLEDMYS